MTKRGVEDGQRGSLEMASVSDDGIVINFLSLNLEGAEKILCSVALQRGGTVSAAAELLGIHRSSLMRRMKRHGLERPRKEQD